MRKKNDKAELLHDRTVVARRLKKKMPDIIDVWASRLHTRVDAARHHNRVVLIDSMPHLLENLVKALGRASWAYPDGASVALVHGKEREAMFDYELSEVIDEYALLREIVAVQVFEQATLHGTREFVHRFIDAAIRSACVAFVERQQRRATRRLVQERNEAVRDRGRAKRALVEARSERDDMVGHIERLSQDRAARSRTIAIVGHDMRAPLTAVLLQAQRLQQQTGEGSPPSKVEAMADRITRGVERLNTMIDSLIEADRVEAAEDAALRVEAGNLGDIVRRAIKTVAGAQEYRFITHFEGSLNGFWDVPAVLRAVENLCTNAIKYGSRERPVTVSCATAGDAARVCVHNHGSYLTARQRRHLFGAYVQARRGESAGSQGGWGLGLVQVKQVADAHGGKVSVHSKAKTGTAFCMHILRDCRGMSAVSKP